LREAVALAVTMEAWDQDPFLLGTPAGAVDLRTGHLRTAEPDEGVTKLTAVAPAEKPTCTRWMTFLDETFGRDLELIRFVKQWQDAWKAPNGRGTPRWRACFAVRSIGVGQRGRLCYNGHEPRFGSRVSDCCMPVLMHPEKAL
jgi:hypothetical protein